MNVQPASSLRRRLFRTVLTASLAWSLVLALAVALTVHHAVEELLDNALQESAEILYGVILRQGSLAAVADGGTLPAPPHEEHLVWQVVDAQGRVTWRSHRAPTTPLQPPQTLGLSSVPGNWQVYGMPLRAQGEVLFVAQVAHVRQATTWAASGTAALVTVLFGGVCALWLRWRVNHELQPVGQLSQAVAHYDPMADSPTMLPITLEELEPMRRAIQDLGERLAQRVASERAFAAHAAHALRTPLAGMMAQLAVAQVKATNDVLPHLNRMQAGLDRLRSVVAALLTLFRAGQATTRPHWVTLSQLATHLPFETLDIQLDASQHNRFQADPDLLSAALINLLDNAQRHGARHVRLSAQVTGNGDWQISLRDDGPGLGDAQRAQLQSALDLQHYEQLTGLGLMLADLIARAHGGRLQLGDDAPGCKLVLSGQAPEGAPLSS